jgi:uncharacterized protein YjbI with pentapeptide repeats
MAISLRFAGKFAYQSTSGTGQQYYLTRFLLIDQKQFMPGMQSTTLDVNQRCIVYQVETETNPVFIIQLATLEYLSFADTGIFAGYIALSSQITEASQFQIASDSTGQQTWQVWDGSQSTPQLYPVGYTPVGQITPSYLLTEDSPSTFAPSQITPALSTIVQSKNGKGMNFVNVDLSGQDVSGVDFTGADFTGAKLTGTIFRGAILTQATFIGATLDGTSFDGATLDQANFSGATTVLATVNWGQPKSAQNINFSGCDGRGTKLVGQSGNVIPFNHANFTNANFSGATLSYVTLDDADSTGAIAAGSNFTGSSLQRVKAHGTNFCGATLNHSDLSNGQFGAKALLFTITSNVSNDISELNQSDGKGVPSDIVSTFQENGLAVSNGIVKILMTGTSWLITVGTTAYNVLLSADGSQLQVYLYSGATPATLAGASLNNSTSTGANFSSVDLSNSFWNETTADHTDLESTNLTGSFLLEANFTQARISGTIFSNAVLIQTKFIDAQLTNPSFVNAQLQGADFTNANIINGNLYQAAIALPFGVPLFVSDNTVININDLNAGNVSAITPVFEKQGYPLGIQASLGPMSGWLIDNSVNTNPSAIKTFYIDASLNVYDFLTPAKCLFTLSSKYKPFLNNSTPSEPLITAFQQNKYTINPQAVISLLTAWKITNSPDAPVNLPVIYEWIAIVLEKDNLFHIYGSTLLWLKNIPAYLSSDIAFGPSQAMQTAVNSHTICANGQPNSEFIAGSYTWEQMMTCPTAPVQEA